MKSAMKQNITTPHSPTERSLTGVRAIATIASALYEDRFLGFFYTKDLVRFSSDGSGMTTHRLGL